MAETVNHQSRNILALTMSADRIKTLRGQIVQFGEHNGAPILFVHVHGRVIEGTGTDTYASEGARSTLRKLSFSAMSVLVTQFKDAADTLHVAQEELVSIAGSDSA